MPVKETDRLRAQLRATEVSPAIEAMKLIHVLRKRGYAVSVNGGQLKVVGKPLPDDLRQQVKEKKDAVLSYLNPKPEEPWDQESADKLIAQAVEIRGRGVSDPGQRDRQSAGLDKVDLAWINQDLKALRGAVSALETLFRVVSHA